jgi:RNAse (barnase) inhibitor barstar
MNTKTVISYHQNGINPNDSIGFVVHIPKGIDDKQALLRLLSSKLNFPSYFGFNWDALDECLADLSWLQERSVIIWHEDVPLVSNPFEARRYLKVLNKVLIEPGNVPITINFPEATRKDIETLLNVTDPSSL